jgi:hypothetical protein
MSALVWAVQVSARDETTAAYTMGECYNRSCRGGVRALLSEALLPRAHSPQIRLVVGRGRRESTFHPLPFVHDGVMLAGQHRQGNTLALVFYHLEEELFLPAAVTLNYAERAQLIGRQGPAFLGRLVHQARAHHARALV